MVLLTLTHVVRMGTMNFGVSNFFFFNAHLFFYPESSMSEVQLEVRGSQASSLGSGEIVRMASGILSSGHTPTPTWTEGTPSFTESSSSGELGKPLEMN